MIQRVRNFFRQFSDGLNTGMVLGVGLIFLTLIGLPSDDSEQLASISVEIFLIISTYIGWRMARQLKREAIWYMFGNAVAVGISASIVLLLFLGLINGWHADGTDVEGLYFANMNTYPMHVLSGVPLEELEPNPPVDRATGEYAEDAVLRTSPFQLTSDSDSSIFALIGIHIGGLYGLALLLSLTSALGGVLYVAADRVEWSQYTESVRRSDGYGRLATVVPVIFHWIVLTIPLLIFAIFWMTVQHAEGLSDSEPFQLIDLNDALGLTSDSLIDAPSLQLGMTFLIVIFLLVALRRAQIIETSLPYLLRFGIVMGIVSVLLGLGWWRINTSDIIVIAPSIDIFGMDAKNWTALAYVLFGLGMWAYIFIGMNDASRFEIVYTAAIGATVFAISPLFMNQYQTFVMGRVMLAVMFGLGLNIVVGYAGLLDLGYVAFYAIGAYTFAFLAISSEQFKLTPGQADMLGWSIISAFVVAPIVIFIGMNLFKQPATPVEQVTSVNAWKKKKPIWPAQPRFVVTLGVFVFAIISSIIFAAILTDGAILDTFGLSAFNTAISNEYFSPFLMATVLALMVGAFAGIMLGFPVLRLRGDYLAIVTLGFGEIISLALKNLDSTTGGPSGAINIPKPVPDGTSVPVSNLILLYLSIVGAIIVATVSLNLRNSRVGRAWLAMRSDEDIAQAMGINLVNVKLLAFSIGAGMAALAGMIFAARQNSIFPDDFNLEVSINVLSLVIIGGMGSVPGVIVGSIVLIGLPELLRPVEDYRIMAFGLLLIVTMITRPEGLLPIPPPSLEDEARALAEMEENGV